jgi:hypothetical protein
MVDVMRKYTLAILGKIQSESCSIIQLDIVLYGASTLVVSLTGFGAFQKLADLSNVALKATTDVPSSE